MQQEIANERHYKPDQIGFLQQVTDWLHRAVTLRLNVLNQQILADSLALILIARFLPNYPS